MGKDSSVPLMHHDPSHLGSKIRIRIFSKKRTPRPTRDGGGKGYRGQKARSSFRMIAGDGFVSLFQDPGLDSRLKSERKRENSSKRA